MKLRLPSWLERLVPRRRPRIDLYALCWNEERMLEYFFRHYDPFVTRYVFFDDGSTDRTLDILRARRDVEIRRFKRSVEKSFVLSVKELEDRVWKESRGRADWVIITCVDEHLHHPDLLRYLSLCKRRGITAVPAVGFQMIEAQFPPPGIHLATSLTRGAPFFEMNKLSIFDPDALEETRFGPGRHSAAPTGRVRYPGRDKLINLHYKYLGLDYVMERHAMLQTGLGETDREKNFGHRYQFTKAQNRADISQFEERAVDIAGPDPAGLSSEPRWWRRTKDAAARGG